MTEYEQKVFQVVKDCGWDTDIEYTCDVHGIYPEDYVEALHDLERMERNKGKEFIMKRFTEVI